MTYSIGQFSDMTNISPHTLQYYEKEQLLIIKLIQLNGGCIPQKMSIGFFLSKSEKIQECPMD